MKEANEILEETKSTIPEIPDHPNLETVSANKESVITNQNPLITDSKMVLKGEHYRISVLTERLLRLEYSPDGVFNDYETQLVRFRNFPKPEFTVTEDNRFLVIRSKYFTLSYTKEKNFDGGKIVPQSNLKVDLNNSDHSWYYHHPEVRNYKGLFVSLDGNEVDAKARNGLYSVDGFASLDDSNTYIYDENHYPKKREKKGIDLYLFIYGKDFQDALKDYFRLTGYPAMIPRYALGNWWSRDLEYKEEEILEIANHFEKREIPLSVLLLDEAWHPTKLTDGTKLSTGYSFHKGLYPNPTNLIEQLHQKNIKVGLNFNPVQGIYPFEVHYQEIASYFKVTDNKIISFDPLNPALLNAIYQFMISPLVKMGVDFFWNDMKTNEISLDGLWFLNESLYTNPNTNSNVRKLILARNALLASHRYPIQYTGKTLVGWEMLKKIPMIQGQASNIGVTWISNDVAGNYGGIEEEELYIRSIELATFGPILRFHAPRGRYYRKEPWRWNARTLEVIDHYLKLRHRLIPYLYSKAYFYHKEGELVIQPLYYDYPWVYDDSNYQQEYYFGEMLISPILTKKDNLINRTIHKFFIPEGIWYDFNTGKKFPGNKQYISFFRDEDYPVFVKRGAIVPLNNTNQLNFTGNPDSFEIHIFPGENSTFNLYEDKDDQEENHLITQIDYNYLPSNYTVIIRTLEGKRGVVSDYRNYKIRFRNTKKANTVFAYFNDTQIKTISYVDDADFIVEAEHVPSIGQFTLNCKGKDIEIDAIRLINDDIDSILLDLPINTVLKEKISSIMFSELPIKRKRIEIRKLRKYNLGREYIHLFLRLLEYIGEI